LRCRGGKFFGPCLRDRTGACRDAGHSVGEKADAGAKLHTTGIIVKDAIDQVALLEGLPSELVRRINGVRLYAPNLRSVDLGAPGYYFLATDTAQVMRWLAGREEEAGAHIAYRTFFDKATRTQRGFDLNELGTAHFLIGADGKQMAQKIDTEKGRAIYHQRIAIVKPVFANIKCMKGLDRFTLRGKIKGNIQWVLYCMVHNICKVLRYGFA
jgi:flavin-dependent dehydrogenase